MSENTRLSDKLYVSRIEGHEAYTFHCPGCKQLHVFTTKNEGRQHPIWVFNGNVDKPSFTPSLLCNPNHLPTRCHLVLIDGQIHYQGDCYHELKGQIIDMVTHDWEE